MKRRNSAMTRQHSGATKHSSLHRTASSSAVVRRKKAPDKSQSWHARIRIPSIWGSSGDNSTEPSAPLLPLSSSSSSGAPPLPAAKGEEEHGDFFNYALLVVLYTLQGIPMGLSASIPFLIQQKMKLLASSTSTAAAAAAATTASAATTAAATSSAAAAASATRLAYNANAIFALCSWPFSLKLLWAPIVDACFVAKFGRRKSWLVPTQTAAGLLMVLGANFVERQLGLTNIADDHGAAASSTIISSSLNIKGVTAFFFVLYFLMATQDIAVDGWALTMLSKKNRGRGPVCNSVGQNIGYFLSFVGFLALNDAESSEKWWRPLLGLPSRPDTGLVSLKAFIRFMGYFMLVTTTAVALFKHEQDYTRPSLRKKAAAASVTNSTRLSPATEALLRSSSSVEDGTWVNHNPSSSTATTDNASNDDLTSMAAFLARERETSSTTAVSAAFTTKQQEPEHDDDMELDASEIGLKETYHRLWAVCKLPAVRWLFLILLTYRLPTALADNVKFLKAVEFGLSKSTTALLSPTVILPLGICVPIVAAKIWHGNPLQQFLSAYKVRVTLAPIVDVLMLTMLQKTAAGSSSSSSLLFWSLLILSTALQATVSSLQFNAQMTFFAHRVDPAIGGSYMTLLNTAANLGGTWPSSLVMWLVARLTVAPNCSSNGNAAVDGAAAGPVCTGGRDPFVGLQVVLSCLGLAWIALLGGRVQKVAALPDEAWRTHLLDNDDEETKKLLVDEEAGRVVVGNDDSSSAATAAVSSWTSANVNNNSTMPPRQPARSTSGTGWWPSVGGAKDATKGE